MSRRGAAVRVAALVLLAFVAMAAPARARQERERVRVERELARVESLIARNDSAQGSVRRQQFEAKRGRLARSGHVAVVMWRAVPSRSTERIARLADSTLNEFGVIPPGVLDAIVVVQAGTSDADDLMRSSPLADRIRVEMDWNPTSGEESGGWQAARAVGMYFRTLLDSSWTAWISEDYGLGWSMDRDGGGALGELARPAFTVGHRCTGGDVTACRQWLGLDSADHAHSRRYGIAEIRRYFADLHQRSRGRTGPQCINDDDDACLRYAETSGMFPPIPSTSGARAGFVRAVQALHGPEAVRRALLDRHGTLGERFARATGVPEDSLVWQWREWILGRGRRDRVRADAGVVAAAMGAMLALLGLATRSGRWHT